MAKDGTMRGNKAGNYNRAGRGVQKTLIEKVNDGTVRNLPTLDTPHLVGNDMPTVESYMESEQHQGIEFRAGEIQQATWKWLRERRCDGFINPMLVNQYAMHLARWIQCEEAISKYGFLSKHPTTSQAMKSPYTQTSIDYSKQAVIVWGQIYQIVQEKCSEPWSGPTPQDDVMEQLLSQKS